MTQVEKMLSCENEPFNRNGHEEFDMLIVARRVAIVSVNAWERLIGVVEKHEIGRKSEEK